MKKAGRRVCTGILSGALFISMMPMTFAATAHFNDSSRTGANSGWDKYVSSWDKTASDLTNVSITPGKDETQLNFAWYSEGKGNATPVVHFGTNASQLQVFKGTAADVDKSLTNNKEYEYNYVTVSGLKANTTYYYTVEKNGKQTEVQTYKTGDFKTAKILYVGDPQVGASKGQTQGSNKLVNQGGSANTAARNDGFAWDRTLKKAVSENPDVNFVISAGDQVNKTGKPKEEEYAAYLSSSVLKSLPVATTIGNHDSLNPDYKYHFNNPNATKNGQTAAGGDYYYSYGSGLFIVLNTNNYNVAEHEKTIKAAVASDSNAKFRIVTIHQDIYGSGLDHSDTDGMILRTQLTPIFDKYNIDVVLQGHDHTYSRTKLLHGDGRTHGSYEFRLNDKGTDYDWNHAFNTQTNEKIPLYPEENNSAEQAQKDKFRQDNNCYTINDVNGNKVKDPEGILYMTANSATGSKYYELLSTQQNYVAKRSQNWLPSYSVINLTDSEFSIDTYQIKDNGQTEKIDETFTIEKTGDDDVVENANVKVDNTMKSVSTVNVEGETYYRLRDLATALNGTDKRFDVQWNGNVVVNTGKAYEFATLSPVDTVNCAASALTISVNGKNMKVSSANYNGNNYVPAGFLGRIGIFERTNNGILEIETGK